jgi:hypothetical protein
MEFSIEILKQKLQQDLSQSRKTNEITYFRKKALLASIDKKFVMRGSAPALHAEAINDFIDRNRNLSQDFPIPESRAQLFKDWQFKLFDILNSGTYQSSKLTLDTCFNYGIAGPGSSRGTKHTNLLDKMFNSALTSDWEGLFSHYESKLPPRWARANEIRKSRFGNKVIIGSLLTSVPKDRKKNRTICTEPSLNMFYQLGAKHIINELLVRHYFLDVRTQQDINKKLAKQGSLDGLNATLDLKNASDSIHLDLCAQLLPKQTWHVLNSIRSQYFETDQQKEHSLFPSSDGKAVFKFNMISSMGNGFTFSLMTLLLVSLLDVFLRTKQDKYVPLRDGVFGDDIIMPSTHANEFCDVLSDFGFTVNLEKSFITGPFRESCGGDYFKGFAARGVYIKEMNCEADVYSAFNRLLRWSSMFGIPIHRTLLYVKGLAQFRPIPQHEADDGGIKVPFQTIQQSAERDRNGSYRYTVMVPVKRFRKISDNEHNFHGALICAIGSYVRGQRITVRNNGIIRRQVKRRVTPNWDYTTSPDFNNQEYERAWLSMIADSLEIS